MLIFNFRGRCWGSPAHASVRVLVLSTVGFYMSTGTYIAALVWQRSQVHRLVSGATNGLFSLSYDGEREMAVFGDLMRKQSWMAVISLEMSVSLRNSSRRERRTQTDFTGNHRRRDCMVARMRYLAQQSRHLDRTSPYSSHSRCVFSVLIARVRTSRSAVSPDLPTVSGLVGSHELRIVETTRISLLEVYNPYIDAFGGLSLATNVLATSLIAFKAWCVPPMPFLSQRSVRHGLTLNLSGSTDGW